MYAAIGVFAHARSGWEKQKEELHARIVPFVKTLPGFVAGYWTYDAETSKSHSLVLFDEEKQARRLVDQVTAETRGKSDAEGVTFESFIVVNVVAEEARD
jgi:hypothetical protein